MKVAALIFAMFLSAVVAVGQVVTLKNDIPESQYVAAVLKGFEILGKSNFRIVWTQESVLVSSKGAKLQEKYLSEFILPDKWRTVREKFYGYPKREENIKVDGSQYVKRDDKAWIKYSRGFGSGFGMGSGYERVSHKYTAAVEFDGGKADVYEVVSERYDNSGRSKENVVVKNIRTTRAWYSADGKILKKTEESTMEGREDVLRETTTYEYDPKDLKIEAPQMK